MPELSPETLIKGYRAALAAGRRDDATHALKRFLILHPGSPQAHVEIAELASSESGFRQAAQCMVRGLVSAPDEAEIHYVAGVHWARSGNRRAATAWRRALCLDPTFLEAWYRLFTLRGRSRSNQTDDAPRRAFIMAANAPRQALRLATALGLERQTRSSLALLRRMTIWSPDSSSVTLTAADQMHAAEHWVDSAWLTTLVAVIRSVDPGSWRRAAERSLQQRRPPNAEVACRRAIASGDQTATTRFLLGRILLARGHEAAAEVELERAVDHEPGLRWYRDLLHMMPNREDFVPRQPRT